MSTAIRPLHTTAPSSPSHIGARWRRTSQRGLVGVALAALLTVAVAVPAAPAHAAGTITVTTTVDEYGAGAACSLREAVRTANDGANFGGCGLSGTQPFTISLPGRIFSSPSPAPTTTITPRGDLDILVSGTALAGAGAASTTIQQTTADRVIDFNPTVASSFSGSLSNLRITGGNVGGTFGGGGIIYGDLNGGGTLTLNGVTVDGNTATQGPGGGIASGARGNLTIINSTIFNKTASSPAAGGGASAGTGGGIDFLDQGGANQLEHHQLDDLGQPCGVHSRRRRRSAHQRRHSHYPAHPLRRQPGRRWLFQLWPGRRHRSRERHAECQFQSLRRQRRHRRRRHLAIGPAVRPQPTTTGGAPTRGRRLWT